MDGMTFPRRHRASGDKPVHGARVWSWCLLGVLVLAAVLLAPAMASAQAERRVALVIGNGAYRHASPLRNAGNDAQRMAEVLQHAGFEVILGVDLDRQAMDARIREFGDRLDGGRLGVFFFAGHGLQVGGENYLLPIDTRLERERDLEFEAVPLNRVLRVAESAAPTNLIFLDACRDNPLTRSLARSMGTRSSAVGAGLAQVTLSGVGTLVAFATQPGNVALDGERGSNSPFTAALAEHIATPGVDIGVAMRRVRETVIAATERRQVPWDHSSLVGDVVLVPVAVRPVQPPPAEQQPPTPPNVSPEAFELTFWQSVQASGTVHEYEEYLRQYPNGRFAGLARTRIEERRRTETPPSQPAAPPVVARDLTQPEIMEVQALLDALGFEPGTADGVAGPRTRAAVEAFARAALRPEETALDTVLLTRLREMTAEFQQLTARPAESPRGLAAAAEPDAGDRYQRGWAAERATPPDYAEARYWYGLSARGENVQALVQLGLMLVRGQGGPADAIGGSLLWRIAAARGNGTAAYNLGAMLENGIGITAHPRWARYWYDVAVEAGHVQARDAVRRLAP